MATFASNGNLATSVMSIAFSLASSSSTTHNPLFNKGTKNFSLARPSYYHNPLFQEGSENSSDDDDFDVDFRDDFTIISNKDEPLDSVDDLAQSLSALHISSTVVSDNDSTSSTQSLRSSGDCSSKTTPKSILKKPKGTNSHDKPKKAVVWHTELAHDIINGEHVPQTQLPREIWYPMQTSKIDAKRAQKIASAMQDNDWVNVSANL